MVCWKMLDVLWLTLTNQSADSVKIAKYLGFLHFLKCFQQAFEVDFLHNR